MFIVPISRMPSIGEVASTQPVQPPQQGGAAVPFADIFAEALENVKATQAVSRQDAYNLAMGQMDDLHTMQINSTKAATAMEFTVELTTRAVSAYNEIMRMQV